MRGRCVTCPRRTNKGKDYCRMCYEAFMRRSAQATAVPRMPEPDDLSEAEIEARYRSALAAIRRRG